MAFIDGDVVDTGNNLNRVLTNAAELRSQRGEGAILDIYDSKLKTVTPS